MLSTTKRYIIFIKYNTIRVYYYLIVSSYDGHILNK